MREFGHRSRWSMLVLALLTALAGVAITLRIGSFSPKPRSFLSLPDGSAVRVMAATYGTNHVMGPVLGRLVARTPSIVQAVLEKLLGRRALIVHTTTSPTPTLVVWLERITNNASLAGRTGYVDAVLSDSGGFASGENGNLATGSWSVPESVSFHAFPRRGRAMALNFYYHDETGSVRPCGRLRVNNPVSRRFPEWLAEPLPVTKRVADVELTLEKLSTGHGHNTTYKTTEGGRRVIEFGSSQADGRNNTICLMRLRPLVATNQVWLVTGVEVSDATGNKLMNSSFGWGGERQGYFTFGPGLWPGESAWNLKCEIKRAAGFDAGETFTFRNVPLGELDRTNHLRWSTNVAGVTVTLNAIYRRPPNTNNSWSSSELSRAHLTVSGLTNGLHLDLLSVLTDNGEKLECPSWSSSGAAREYSFRNIPEEARWADFIFAVQRSRWVEFRVKPEVGSAQVEY